MSRRKKGKKGINQQKGPLAMLTLGQIMSAILTALILGMALLFFETLSLTPTTMLIILVLCFAGMIIAKVLITVAEAKIKF